MRLAACSAVATLALVCVGCGGHAAAQKGPRYDVNGHILYMQCTGRGSPAVILEAGLGTDHTSWSVVQPVIARTTRVCSYDRFGVGLSDLAPKRATARSKVKDLHDLLAAANVSSPYVLVGHSYGGLLVHLYAATYAKDVDGVVLVDSSHPGQIGRLLAALPPRRTGEPTDVRVLREGFRTGSNPEGVDWKRSADEVRRAPGLGDTPLVVVTAGDQSELVTEPAIARRLQRAWFGLQDDLARLSIDSLHVIALHSTHFVMASTGQPWIVARAVRAVVAAVREHAKLPACRALFAAAGARCVAP
jgi:pimeloyl-ACP methyl ester carboxylesterase